MKKQYTIAALSLAAVMVLTGCSMKEFKAKFVGETNVSPSAVSTDGVVEIEKYVANECVVLAKYKGVEVDCKVTDKELQESIDQTLKQHATTKEKKKGKAKKGDTVTIDFEGKLDGTTPFDNGSGEDYPLELGSGTFIAGFEDGIIGMKVGETKDLKLKFPDNYGSADLAGKDVTFTVTVKSITENVMPELTDKFVKKNCGYDTVEEYKREEKKSLIQEKKDSAAETVLSTVVANSTVNRIPETLRDALAGQIDALNRYYLKGYFGESTDFETALSTMNMTKEQYDSSLKSEAESNAKMVLVIEAIAEKEGITVSDEEVQTALDNTVSGSGVSSVEELYQQYETLYGKSIPCEDNLRSTLLDQKVMELLENTCVLKE